MKSVYPDAVNADKMWQSGYSGNGVTVALIDTGIANVPDLAGRDSRLGSDRAQSGEHARFWGLCRGEDLCRESPLGRFQRDVGERAADVDADPDCR